uniref:Uncharacterized protein n=1 Tax=Ditylum brightwellii TaxID=49249 RepID=A0A6U3RF17_9STRA
MKSLRALAIFGVTLLTTLRSVSADSGDGEWEDDDYFFAVGDTTRWADYSIMAHHCINFNDEDVVTFSIFGEGNKQCSKKKQGTYTMPVGDFLRGLYRQNALNAEMKGYELERPEAMNFINCQYAEVNDKYIYVKIGCHSASGNSIALSAYSDSSCTVKANYNTNALGIDLSGLKVHYGSCDECVYWPSSNAYNGDDGFQVDDNFNEFHAYDSPLCSVANAYKSTCNGRCKRLSSSFDVSDGRRQFSIFGKVMLFVFGMIGIFSLLAVRGQRMKMSQEQALVEEAVVRKAGLEMKNIGLIIIVVVILIALSIFLRFITLTWALLISMDVLLIGYWLFLHFRSTGKSDMGSGFRLFGSSNAEEA